MSDTLIKEALTQAPSLGVLVIVVWLFLRFMERSMQSLQSMMREMHTQHMEAREQSRLVISENSQVMRDFVEAKGMQ